MIKENMWVVYDQFSKTQSRPLKQSEMQMALLRMRKEDWPRFFVWTTGWQKWQPLDLFLQSDQRHFLMGNEKSEANEDTVRTTIREVLEMKPASKKTEAEITKSQTHIKVQEDTITQFQEVPMGSSKDAGSPEEISLNSVNPPKDLKFKKATLNDQYAKRAERHELKIELVLVSKKGKTFRSYSKNISLSGSLLEDHIPFDYYGQNFDLVVVDKSRPNSPESRVHLKAITIGEGLTQRLKFLNPTPTQIAQLKKLLMHYLSNQKKTAA